MVFRLGKVVNVLGPGAVWFIPIVDHLAVIDLDRALPGWETLPEHELKLVACHIVEMYLREDQVNLDLGKMRADTRNAPRVPKSLRTFPYE